MFAVGHFALAYLLGKSSAKLLKTNLNIPLILVLAILPDADILLGGSELHRGPTHSIITALLIFIPLIAIYRRKALPYLLALLSHSLIADFLIGGQIMLFWPLTTRLFGLNNNGFYIGIWNPINITLEWTLFIIATIVMLKTRDTSKFFLNNKTNLLLIIPISTVLLPTLISYPIPVPFIMMPPHIFYMALFSLSILSVIAGTKNQKPEPPNSKNHFT